MYLVVRYFNYMKAPTFEILEMHADGNMLAAIDAAKKRAIQFHFPSNEGATDEEIENLLMQDDDFDTILHIEGEVIRFTCGYEDEVFAVVRFIEK
jgi:hypothetical protein